LRFDSLTADIITMATGRRLARFLQCAVTSASLTLAQAKRAASVSSVEEFWAFVAAVYALVLLPIVALVVYSAVRDPAVREVWTLLCTRLKQRTCGFLGRSGSAIRSPAIMDRHRQAAREKQE
jgi:hypothetical protein